MSAVCGVNVNDEEHENRHGSLEFVMNSRKDFFVVLERSGKGPEHHGEGCAGDGEECNKRVHSEFERSCAEKPERVRPDEVCKDSSITERK